MQTPKGRVKGRAASKQVVGNGGETKFFTHERGAAAATQAGEQRS